MNSCCPYKAQPYKTQPENKKNLITGGPITGYGATCAYSLVPWYEIQKIPRFPIVPLRCIDNRATGNQWHNKSHRLVVPSKGIKMFTERFFFCFV